MKFQINEALPCTGDLRVYQWFINLDLMKNAKHFFCVKAIFGIFTY